VLTVSALARSVRDLLERQLPLAWVTGEISNFTAARSGHWYFSLKDAGAQVRCVMFRGRNQHLDWQPREGMQVDVRALPGFYEARGDFQLTVETMRQAGLGALYERFLRLRDALAAEGLFDPLLRRALPAWPRRIGVISSTAGAALHDVLATLDRRNPLIEVVIYPSAVQGEQAADELVRALDQAGRRGEVDVILLVRGGGSIEDLWSFNDETLARAIRACPIPVISGVGHETDVTIADFVADCRAPTPTAAAELVSPPLAGLAQAAREQWMRLARAFDRGLELRALQMDSLVQRLEHPADRIALRRDRLAAATRALARAGMRARADRDTGLKQLLHRLQRARPATGWLSERTRSLALRLDRTGSEAIASRRARLQSLGQALLHLNPARVLDRGFGIVIDSRGHVVSEAASAAPGDRLSVRLSRGELDVRVEQVMPPTA
jgi:exodeoxyribonuclease VII large subunit